jgi:hypothetical protein
MLPTTTLDYSTLPDHQLLAVKCSTPIKRTHVSREMVVCKDCTKYLGQMRSMLQRYDKTGSIRGTAAFEKFLVREGDGGGEREGDLTVPVDEEDGEGLVNADGPRGLGTLEREGDGYQY